MVGITQLRYFVTLAETLHYGRAAERLHITQPPLTRQIANLEKELGVTLLERGGRATALTRAGQKFRDDAVVILGLLDQATRSAGLVDRGMQGELSIGFMMCSAYHVVPTLTRAFRGGYPDVELKLREFIPSALAADLATGAVDAGILFPLPAMAGLKTRTIYREPLCVALPPGHRLSGARSVQAGDLAEEAFIASPRDVGPTLYDAIMAYCAQAGFQPKVKLEIQMQQTIMNFVAEGLGVAIVPDSMRRMQLPGVVFCSLDDPPVIEQVIAWNPNSSNPTLERLLEVVDSLPQEAALRALAAG